MRNLPLNVEQRSPPGREPQTPPLGREPQTSPPSPLSLAGEGEPEGGLRGLVTRSSVDSAKVALARAFRKAPTPAENVAWGLLRGRRMLGLKFRRQQVIEGFVVDFYCAELRLALELDGSTHDTPEAHEYDAVRTNILSDRGVTVVRIRNDDLTIDSLSALLSPLSRKGEGGQGGEVCGRSRHEGPEVCGEGPSRPPGEFCKDSPREVHHA